MLLAEQTGQGNTLGRLSRGTKHDDLLAYSGRIPFGRGSGPRGNPGKPAGQQLATLDTQAWRSAVFETAMVHLGNSAKADQVLDQTGKGGVFIHAAKDESGERGVQLAEVVEREFTRFLKLSASGKPDHLITFIKVTAYHLVFYKVGLQEKWKSKIHR